MKTVKDAENLCRDNENNRWKRNAKSNKRKTKKDRKEQAAEAIVKGWEVNDFVVHLS